MSGNELVEFGSYQRELSEVNWQNHGLCQAALTGQCEILKQLLDEGFDIDELGALGYTPLMCAAVTGQAKALKMLLENGAEVTLCCRGGENALILCSSNGHLECVTLLAHELSMTDIDKRVNGFNALELALKKGFWDIAWELLKPNPDLIRVRCSWDPSYATGMLSFGCEKGLLHLVEKLVDLISNKPELSLDDRDKNGLLPIEVAIDNGKWQIVQLLINRNSPLQIDPKFLERRFPPKYVISLFIAGIERGLVDLVSSMISKGVDVNKVDASGKMPLEIATKKKQWHVADLLVWRGASVELCRNEFQSVRECVLTCSNLLCGGCQHGCDKLVKALLIHRECDVNHRTDDGKLLIELVCDNKNWQVASYLIQYDADVNLCTDKTKTVQSLLFGFTELGEINLVQKMIKMGANIKERNEDNKLPYDIAAEKRHLEIAYMLLDDLYQGEMNVDVIGIDPNDEEMQKLKNDPHVYTIQRGRALIINNVNDRPGSQYDAHNMSALLKKLGYVVTVKNNVTRTALDYIVAEERDNIARHNADAFICTIFSYGNMNSVYMTDGQSVSLDHVIRPFDGKHCLALVERPKLFIVQVCQGTARVESPNCPIQRPIAEHQSDVVVDTAYETMWPCTIDEWVRHPKSGVFVAHATVKDEASWRDPRNGSWFINTIVKVFMVFAHKKHLADLFARVEEELDKKATYKEYIGLSGDATTLFKPWYFFPNATDNNTV